MNPPLIRFISHHTSSPVAVKMRIRPVVAERKLSRRLFEQLADEIKSGQLAPGARLPAEQALTRAARVSRTVVREAVALRAEGLVVTRQGVGAFVSATERAFPHRARAHAVPGRYPFGDGAQAWCRDRIRPGLRPSALAREHKKHRKRLGRHRARRDEGRSAVDEDLGFHRAIAEATGNRNFPASCSSSGAILIPRRTVSGLPARMGGERAYLALIQEERRRISRRSEPRCQGRARSDASPPHALARALSQAGRRAEKRPLDAKNGVRPISSHCDGLPTITAHALSTEPGRSPACAPSARSS